MEISEKEEIIEPTALTVPSVPTVLPVPSVPSVLPVPFVPSVPSVPIEKKKRGRRKKEIVAESNNNIQLIIEESNDGSTTSEPAAPVIKKRGRKPKGGKLILKQPEQNMYTNQVSNIILHLKCSLSDLNEYNANLNKLVTNPMNYNPAIPPDILTYNDEVDNQLFFVYDKNKNIEVNNAPTDSQHSINYAYIESNHKSTANPLNQPYICQSCNSTTKPDQTINNDETSDNDDNVNMKDVNYKLKKLKISLYKNAIQDKKSACFWCTYEFDNPPCYIPKYEMDSTVHGYGSFCRPECAVAYLMKENIDDSAKFERYHLLNQIYSKVYNFKKNIKPAPNPYYLLDKFYGNLSIQEYRKLLKTEHMLLVIDKPLTRILPELHEDNEDIVLNVYGGNKNSNGNTTGIYKVKRQSEKQVGPTKNSIMRNKFGLAP
jgi:hypothetical protein